MFDRRTTLGMSVDELVMARVGQVVGALCLFILLPLLPVLVVVVPIAKFVKGRSTDGTSREVGYRPGGDHA